MNRTIRIIFITLCVVTSYCMHAAPTQPTRLLLTYIPNIQFAPFYLALNQGYFRDEGLTVTLEYLADADVVDLVASARADFGLASGEQVILARDRGRPITYVYTWFQQYPIGVVTTKRDHLTSIRDLKHQRIGLPGRFGASYSGLTALLTQSGMTERDVELVEIGFHAPDVFCTGAVDAAVVHVNNEPLEIRQRIQQGTCGNRHNIQVIPITQLASNGLITHEALIKKRPERIRQFINAFDRGLQETIDNPAVAYLASRAYIEILPMTEPLHATLTAAAVAQKKFLATKPTRLAIARSHQALRQQLGQQFDQTLLLQFDILLASLPLWDAEILGTTQLRTWQNMQQTLRDMKLLTHSISLEQTITNQFLPTLDR